MFWLSQLICSDIFSTNDCFFSFIYGFKDLLFSFIINYISLFPNKKTDVKCISVWIFIPSFGLELSLIYWLSFVNLALELRKCKSKSFFRNFENWGIFWLLKLICLNVSCVNGYLFSFICEFKDLPFFSIINYILLFFNEENWR